MFYQKEIEDRIIRVHIAARLLGCSERTIRRYIQNRILPACRLGRRAWGIRFSDLIGNRENQGGEYAGN